MTRRHRPPSESNKPWTTSAAHNGWHRADFGVLCYATLICEGALARMAVLTHRYRKDSSATTGTRYYMNHCEHCDAKLGDFETIEE